MALTRIGNQAITLDAAEIPNIPADKITSGTMDAARIGSGTLANARIAEASVTQHVTPTDLQPIKSDISALALREATNESSAAFNLPNQFIDTFTDDTNLGTQTTVDRTSGYISSITSTTDANLISLFSPNTTDHSTSTTSISSSKSGDSATLAKVNTSHSGNNLVAISPFSGGMSLIGTSAGDGGWKINPTSSYDFGTNDWTVEGWSRRFGSDDGNHRYILDFAGTNNYDRISLAFRDGNSAWLGEVMDAEGYSIDLEQSQYFANNTWRHWAFVKDSGTTTLYINGARVAYGNNASNVNWNSQRSGVLSFQQRHGSDTNGDLTFCYTTEIRISNNARYSGSSHTVPSAKFVATTTSVGATGTLIQSANTVGSAKTKVGGTMLYKDNQGTATLGTDLKIYFTCNGGTNWTEASSYNAVTPVYSTGIKQVRLGETTCTSGTDIRYKAVWANQASGSKETQLHGIGINY